MIPAVWMVTASVGSAVVAAFVAPAAAGEILLGMAAPLLAVVATGVLAERTYNTDPTLLLPAMLKALLAKVIFFTTYVVAGLRGLELQPEPFVLSFVVYFVALYGVQAALLERLFGRAWRGAR